MFVNFVEPFPVEYEFEPFPVKLSNHFSAPEAEANNYDEIDRWIDIKVI
jgi:hypothetical protein